MKKAITTIALGLLVAAVSLSANTAQAQVFVRSAGIRVGVRPAVIAPRIVAPRVVAPRVIAPRVYGPRIVGPVVTPARVVAPVVRTGVRTVARVGGGVTRAAAVGVRAVTPRPLVRVGIRRF